MQIWKKRPRLQSNLSPRVSIARTGVDLADSRIDAGQICTASSRAYVEKPVAEKFKQILAAGFNALKQGNPAQSDTNVGPQADSTQAKNILRYLELAKKEGKVIAGGEKASEQGENFIRPTILTQLPDSSRANVEEIFGPVLILHEFETEQEALQRANDTECELPRLL
jgi:aldehyde dehydrogenase (NAD+)